MAWDEIKKAVNSNLAKPLNTLITEKAAEIMDISTTGVGQTVFSYASELVIASSTTEETKVAAKFIAPKDGIYKYALSQKGGATSVLCYIRISTALTVGNTYISYPIGQVAGADTSLPSILSFYSSSPSYASTYAYFSLKKGDVAVIFCTGSQYLTIKNQLVTCSS